MEIDAIRIFVKVVQLGGFSKAALSLALPTSNVSRAISQLEKKLGVKLLLRTTRRLNLTPIGHVFFENSVNHIVGLEEAQKSIQGLDNKITGKVKISATEDFGEYIITPVISRLIKDHPGLSFEVYYTNENVDFIKDRFDFALRIGQSNNQDQRSIYLGKLNLIAVASPGYLIAHKSPGNPNELELHHCLVFGPRSKKNKWTFQNQDQQLSLVLSEYSMINEMQSLVSMAIHGAGISFVPKFICQSSIESGKLVRVLPEWTIESYDIQLVFPKNNLPVPARVKKTVDGILNHNFLAE